MPETPFQSSSRSRLQSFPARGDFDREGLESARHLLGVLHAGREERGKPHVRGRNEVESALLRFLLRQFLERHQISVGLVHVVRELVPEKNHLGKTILLPERIDPVEELFGRSGEIDVVALKHPVRVLEKAIGVGAAVCLDLAAERGGVLDVGREVRQFALHRVARLEENLFVTFHAAQDFFRAGNRRSVEPGIPAGLEHSALDAPNELLRPVYVVASVFVDAEDALLAPRPDTVGQFFREFLLVP